MAMLVPEGRTLPSVFSDFANRGALQEKEKQIQDARKRIGALGMWVFVLIGAVILALAAAGAAYYYYDLKRDQLADLQGAYNDLERRNAAYQELTQLRADIEASRRTLLNRIEGVNGMPRLNDRQRREGWAAATAAGLRAVQGGDRPTNEASQMWLQAQDDAERRLQSETPILTAADAAVRTAHARYAGSTPSPTCTDPRNC